MKMLFAMMSRWNGLIALTSVLICTAQVQGDATPNPEVSREQQKRSEEASKAAGITSESLEAKRRADEARKRAKEERKKNAEAAKQDKAVQ